MKYTEYGFMEIIERHPKDFFKYYINAELIIDIELILLDLTYYTDHNILNQHYFNFII